jgi:hypothetical protein
MLVGDCSHWRAIANFRTLEVTTGEAARDERRATTDRALVAADKASANGRPAAGKLQVRLRVSYR